MFQQNLKLQEKTDNNYKILCFHWSEWSMTHCYEICYFNLILQIYNFWLKFPEIICKLPFPVLRLLHVIYVFVCVCVHAYVHACKQLKLQFDDDCLLDIALCSPAHPEDGGSKLLLNASQYLPDHMAQHPRRWPSTCIMLWLFLSLIYKINKIENTCMVFQMIPNSSDSY